MLLGPAVAPAAASDAPPAAAYVQADYRLVQFSAARIGVGESAIAGVLGRLRGECPGAAAQSPQNAESTQLSNEVIGAMVTSAIARDRPAIHEFLRVAAGLHFGSRAAARAVRAYVGNLRALAALTPPNVCADVRAWAAGGFHALAPSTLAFAPRFMEVWVAVGEIPSALTLLETGRARGLARLAGSFETQISDFESREVEKWGQIMNVLALNP